MPSGSGIVICLFLDSGKNSLSKFVRFIARRGSCIGAFERSDLYQLKVGEAIWRFDREVDITLLILFRVREKEFLTRDSEILVH